MVVLREIELSEVSKHNSLSDGWVVIDGSVYDISGFTDRHPGGTKVLRNHLGKDATIAFRQLHQHSDAAEKMLTAFHIGVIPGRNISEAYQRGRSQEKIEIDFDRPMLNQVWRLGDDYLDWVHTPVEKSLRLFKYDWLELFTRTPWWVIPLIYFPLTAWAIYLSIREGAVPLQVLASFALGIVIWTLTEYLLHRHVFHCIPPPKPVSILLHFLSHGIHHLTPMDKDRLVFPPILGLGVYWLGYKGFPMIFGDAVGYSVMAGFTFGYICYDCTHYYVHHQEVLTEHMRSMKQYHMAHHYRDHDRGFGVTMKLWDYVFGTTPRPQTRANPTPLAVSPRGVDLPSSLPNEPEAGPKRVRAGR